MSILGRYDSEAVARYFDALGFEEFERHDKSPVQRIKHALHVACLRDYVAPGMRVLDLGAGPGRFTEVLAGLGCRVTVIDLSAEQVRLNEERAMERGYAASIDRWLQADMCDLGELGSEPFDAIVAFGGPFSYVLDQRDRAMRECLGRLRPRGRILMSVMSKWGTTHAFLRGVLDLPRDEADAVVRTGDITPQTSPSSVQAGHFCHMFTSAELCDFISSHGMRTIHLSASNALSTHSDEVLMKEGHFAWVAELERAAATSPGAVDMGTHIIAVAERADEADA
jgi:cyclopropane fatty-acyl-phospholipid synthase-like methyltransferase